MINLPSDPTRNVDNAPNQRDAVASRETLRQPSGPARNFASPPNQRSVGVDRGTMRWPSDPTRNVDNAPNQRDAVADRETLRQPSGPRSSFKLFYKLLNCLPRPLQNLLIVVLDRARNPEPEAYDVRSQGAARQIAVWGWLPWLAFVSAVGMALIAYGFIDSRDGGTGLRIFFYPGLLLIFTPTALRLISPVPSRAERIGLLCILGIYCYLIKVMDSPLYFSFYNEFMHWRTVDDIVRSGHLFTQNPLLPVSPYYPGLEIVTGALSTLSGLDTFTSGLIVVGIARLLIVLTLFALNEQMFKSSRMASIATILYMANPHFLLYDSQFGYESLALPLAVFLILITVSYQSLFLRLASIKPFSSFRIRMFPETPKEQSGDLRWLTLTTWIVLLALTFTHHMTDFSIEALLVIWALVYGFQSLTPRYRSNIARTALFGVLIAVAWVSFSGNPVLDYLFSYFSDALSQLGNILAGTGSSRQLFAASGGPSTLLWERVVMALPVALIVLLGLPFGLLSIWQRYRSNALIYTFGIISLFYPISQVFRFTSFGGNLTDRAAAVLFIPLGSVLAIFITQLWPTRQLNRGQSSLITCIISVIFLGGSLLGAGSGLSSLPGPYNLGDPRAIEIEGIQAAKWAYSYLGPNNRVGTDAINQVLMGSYGDEQVGSSAMNHRDVSPVFFSPRLSPKELKILKTTQVRYLVVDLRLSQWLPASGTYFSNSEPDANQHTTPISLKALTKFDNVSQINRVFDSGNIVIYDVRGLSNAS